MKRETTREGIEGRRLLRATLLVVPALMILLTTAPVTATAATAQSSSASSAGTAAAHARTAPDAASACPAVHADTANPAMNSVGLVGNQPSCQRAPLITSGSGSSGGAVKGGPGSGTAALPGWNLLARSSPSIRDWDSMDYDSNRKETVLFGGNIYDSPGTINTAPANDTWTWDGAGWQLVQTSTQPSPRYGATMVYDAAQGVSLLFGGMATTASAAGVVGIGGDSSETWAFDGTSWTQLHPLTSPPDREWATMAYDAARGQVVLFGGIGGADDNALDDTWIWNGTTWTQETPSTAPVARYLSAMGYDPVGGDVVLFGGSVCTDVTVTPPYNKCADGNDTWTWDGTTWTQQTPSTSPLPRDGATLTIDPGSGQLLLAGGQTYPNTECQWPGCAAQGTWTWDGATWRSVASGNFPIYNGAAAADATGSVLVFGGQNGAGPDSEGHSTLITVRKP